MRTLFQYVGFVLVVFAIWIGMTVAQTGSGFSPIDRTNESLSNQNLSLAPHPTPPTVTPLERIPLDKIKLPAGFKAEIFSNGHPGGRTMVIGPRGTIFVGTRQLGRVYAITNQGGKREVKV